MIKNDCQCIYTKKKLCEFKEDLKAIRKKYFPDKNKVALLSQGYIEHIAQLENEIRKFKEINE